MVDIRIQQERQRRLTAIEKIVSEENPEMIQKGIDAYKRDLPSLLASRKALQKVAYRGDEQIAIAPTYDKLERLLKRRGCTSEGELFITTISEADAQGAAGPGR